MTNIGILLAAGFGRRYADCSLGMNKLLATLPDGTSVAGASAKTLNSVVDITFAVIRPNSPDLSSQLRQEGCHILETADAEYGMGASLAAAAYYLRSNPDLNLKQTPAALIVALADMPWIKSTTYQAVLNALKHHLIVAPSYQGVRSHPVGFNSELLLDLSQLSGDVGAKKLIKKYGVKLLACNDMGVVQDVDVPADLPKNLK